MPTAASATSVAPKPERLVVMGRILGAHGVGGAVRVESYCEPPEALLRYRTWWLTRPDAPAPRPVKVERGSSSTKGLLVELAGLADRDAAAAMKGHEIAVDRSLLPALPAGRFYWTDLEGLFVRTADGRSLGVVDHLFDSGAHPLLVTQDGDRQRLIPFVWERVVQSVDLESKQIVVDWDPDF